MDHSSRFINMGALQNLFEKHFGKPAATVVALPGAGSDRKYFRMTARDISVIGAYNPDHRENRVYLYLSAHFIAAGLPVPMVFASDPNEGIYLLQDLGDETLLSWIEKSRKNPDFPAVLTEKYKRVLNDLLRFQINGDKGLDYNQLPVPTFDEPSMHWDLNYFKYYFLKPAGILFDEKALENDFETLVDYLSAEKIHGFMYRDFQSRNIMLQDESCFYIDFQGGRKGPLQYDLASLLFQVKATLPDDVKEQLTDYYIEQLQSLIKLDAAEFKNRLKGFVLLRLLQVMGAYGFRGWFENKRHFIESINLLQPNLKWIFEHKALPGELPELRKILREIKEMMENDSLVSKYKLAVNINSFSYRRGIPYDPSGHGGGFVFDCRLLPNPGRLEHYRQLTGMDKEVVSYLENEPAVKSFVENMQQIIGQAVESYTRAGYTQLQVNFGCTGGRHRSVYCAEKLAAALRSHNLIAVALKHHELQNLLIND